MKTRHSARTAVTYGLLLALSACADPQMSGPSESAVALSDSAGIQIVENHGPDRELALEEVLRIGVTTGEEEYQFEQIVGVAPDGDGGIWVAQIQPPVRRYDAEGTFVGEVAHFGEGPGEFTYVLNVFSEPENLPPDGVVVYGGEPRRLEWISMTEGRMRESPTSDGRSYLDPIGVAQGTVLLQHNVWSATPPKAIPHRTPRTLYRIGESSTVAEPFDTIDGPLRKPFSGQTDEWVEGSFLHGEHSIAMDGTGRIHISDTTRYVVRTQSLEGEEFREVRRSVEGVETDLGWIDRLEETIAEELTVEAIGGELGENDVRWIMDSQTPIDPPGHLPMISDLLASPNGTLWVRRGDRHPDLARYAVWIGTGFIPSAWPADVAGPNRFDLFDPDGAYRGSVSIHDRFRALFVTDDRVYGVEHDEFDVEYVVAYQISSGGLE